MVGVIALVFGLAAWRLNQGPISLAFLTPYLNRALSYAELNVRVEIGDTVLAWSGLDRPIEIRLVDTRMVNRDGTTIFSTPEASVSLSPSRMLDGQIAPSVIDLRGMRVMLTRNDDGQLGLGLGRGPTIGSGETADDDDDPDGSSGDFVADVMRVFAEKRAGSPLGALEKVVISDATIEYDDRPTNTEWSAEHSNLVIMREDGGVRVDLDLNVDLGAAVAHVAADVHVLPATGMISFNAGFANIEPAMIAAKVPQLADAAGIRVPLSGRVTLSVGTDRRISDVVFHVTGAAGSVALPKVYDDPIAIKSFSADGAVVDRLAGLTLDAVKIATDGVTINLSGSALEDGDNLSVEVEATLADLSVDQLKKLWPKAAVPDGRDWVVANLHGGRVPQGRFKLKLSPEEIRTGKLKKDAFTLDFACEGVRVDYLRPMPAALEAGGTGRLTPDALRLSIATAAVGDLKLTDSKVDLLGLDVADQSADVLLNVAGPLRDAIALLDSKPFGFASKLGLQPSKFSGMASTTLSLKFPMEKTLTVKKVNFQANATMSGVSLSGIGDRYTIADGDLKLAANKDGLDLSGEAKFEGVPVSIGWRQEFDPRQAVQARYRLKGAFTDDQARAAGFDPGAYVQGRFGLDVNAENRGAAGTTARFAFDLTEARAAIPEIFWHKPVGKPGQAEMAMTIEPGGNVHVTRATATAGDFVANVTAEIVKGRLVRADLARVKWAGGDVRGTIGYSDGGGYAVEFSGPYVDMRPFIERILSDVPSPDKPRGGAVATEKVTVRLRAAFDRAQFDGAEALSNLTLSLLLVGEVTMNLDLSGQFGDKALKILITPTGDKRTLSVTSDRPEPLLGYFKLDDIAGGKLKIDGTFANNTDPQAPLDARIELTDFRITKASALTQILTLGSLDGIADTMRGDGIAFQTADIPFRNDKDAVTFKGARILGAALGIRADGYIRHDDSDMNVNGTLAPAYTINSLLGKIPLLGPLLVGKEGEGLVAISFTVTGKTSDPQISVQPLSLLTPGAFRRIFDFGSADDNPTPNPPMPNDTR